MEKICKNCKYYVPHYIKYKMRFKTVSGHCSHAKRSRTGNRFFSSENYCELWEQAEDIGDIQIMSVCEAILKMQEQLTQLLDILNCEK